MWRGITAGSCLAVVVVAGISGQSQRSPATLDDLLAELRGLRSDLNASVGINTRAQVIVGRLGGAGAADHLCRSRTRGGAEPSRKRLAATPTHQ